MNRIVPIALVMFTGACTIHQQNGQDLRLDAPPLFGGQEWHVTEQHASRGGSGICTLSFGELNITQRVYRGHTYQQVATSTPLDPGESYSIIIRGQHYETPQAWFSINESDRIIDNMMHQDTAYTEAKKIVTGRRHSPGYRRMTNKIDLRSFRKPYEACSLYLQQASQ